MTATPAAATLAAQVSERDFTNQVIALAQLKGWLVHHCRPAMRQSGRWSTPIQGDAGFPDVVMVRNERVVFAELKREKGQLSETQRGWVSALLNPMLATNSRVQVFIWRPSNWDFIEKILS